MTNDWRDKYDYVGDFLENGLAEVELNGKWGYVNQQGKEVIPPKYDDVWGFFEGLARVLLNDQWGFIDKTGKEVIPLKYDDVDLFEFLTEGLAKVKLNGKWGYIDEAGNEYWNMTEDEAREQMKNR